MGLPLNCAERFNSAAPRHLPMHRVIDARTADAGPTVCALSPHGRTPNWPYPADAAPTVLLPCCQEITPEARPVAALCVHVSPPMCSLCAVRHGAVRPMVLRPPTDSMLDTWIGASSAAVDYPSVVPRTLPSHNYATVRLVRPAAAPGRGRGRGRGGACEWGVCLTASPPTAAHCGRKCGGTVRGSTRSAAPQMVRPQRNAYGLPSKRNAFRAVVRVADACCMSCRGAAWCVACCAVV